jgi:alpha-1,2-mannosyltransferase
MQDSSLAPDGVPGNGRSLSLGIVHGLWIALAVAVCIRAAVKPENHTVYPVLVTGTERWWHDQPLHEWIISLDDIYRYSPTFAVLFTPLAKLPAWLGASLWGLLNIGLFYAALRAMIRDLIPGDWPKRRKAAFFGLALWVAAPGIWSAQSNALVIALAVFSCAAIIRRRWWTSAIMLGLALFIKIWPIALVLLLVTFWPKRLSWRFAVAFIILAAIPFLTRPPSTVIEQYHEWYESLSGYQSTGRWPGERDIRTILENFAPPLSQTGYHVLQLVTAALVWAWCIVQWNKLRVESRESRAATSGSQPSTLNSQLFTESQLSTLNSRLLTLILSIWVAWQLLFGPGSEQLTYGILAPSAAWAVLLSFTEKRHRIWTLSTCILVGLLGSGDAEKFFQKILLALHLPLTSTFLLPLAAASFLAWLLWNNRK